MPRETSELGGKAPLKRGRALRVISADDERQPRVIRPRSPEPKPKRTGPIKVVRSAASATPRQKKISKPKRATGPSGRYLLDRTHIDGKRYDLSERIGEGGSGRVYLARDLLLDMPVAVKILDSRLLEKGGAAAEFKREARLAMQLAHPNIVKLYNLVLAGATYYLVMEYVKGRSFRRVIEEFGCMSVGTVSQIVYSAAAGLSHAHRHGVLHNDLKPDNLLLSDSGVLRIIDFGIACLKLKAGNSDYIEGTPVYMSPEQIRCEPLDVRSDVFGLGVVTCELLTGRPPFPAENDLQQAESRPPADLSALPQEVAAVLAKAVELDRTCRWDSVEAFAEAFAAAADVEVDQISSKRE